MKRHEKGLIIAALAISAFLVLLPKVWCETVHLHADWGQTMDSITLTRRENNAAIDSITKPSTSLIDTNLTITADMITSFVLRGFLAPDSAASWVWQYNRRTTNGPIYWPQPMFWPYSTDSVRLNYYKDATKYATTKVPSTKQSFDSSVSMNRDTTYSVYADLYPTSVTIPVTWGWSTRFTRVDTGSISAPSLTTCRVFGWIFKQGGATDPAKGALVSVGRSASSNSPGRLAAGSRFGVTSDVQSVRADTSGYFNIVVVGSDQYTDTTNAYYDVWANWKGAEIFRVNHVWLTGGTSVNIMDTLAARK